MTTEQLKALKEQMFQKFGPIIGGKELYAALGFKTYSSFHRVKQLAGIGVHVFPLPGRKGWFAMTEEVATWLENQASHSESKST